MNKPKPLCEVRGFVWRRWALLDRPSCAFCGGSRLTRVLVLVGRPRWYSRFGRGKSSRRFSEGSAQFRPGADQALAYVSSTLA